MKRAVKSGSMVHGRESMRCAIFHCDKTGNRYCCYWCRSKRVCRNPCLNNPSKCGAFFETEKRKANDDTALPDKFA